MLMSKNNINQLTINKIMEYRKLFLMNQKCQNCHCSKIQQHPRPAISSYGSRNLQRQWSRPLGHGAGLTASKSL